MKKPIVIGAISLVLTGLILTSILNQQTPEGLCREAFQNKFGDRISSFQVKEKTWNAIEFDLHGFYNNGEWSCALGNNPMVFNQGILFPRDSRLEVFSNEDIN